MPKRQLSACSLRLTTCNPNLWCCFCSGPLTRHGLRFRITPPSLMRFLRRRAHLHRQLPLRCRCGAHRAFQPQSAERVVTVSAFCPLRVDYPAESRIEDLLHLHLQKLFPASCCHPGCHIISFTTSNSIDAVAVPQTQVGFAYHSRRTCAYDSFSRFRAHALHRPPSAALPLPKLVHPPAVHRARYAALSSDQSVAPGRPGAVYLFQHINTPSTTRRKSPARRSPGLIMVRNGSDFTHAYPAGGLSTPGIDSE